MSESSRNRVKDAGESQSEASLIPELWYFLQHNKRCWMLPIVVLLLLFGALIFL